MRALVVWSFLGLALVGGCAGSRELPGDADVPDADDSVDVVGSWHTCSTTVTFAPDGSATLVEHRHACNATGTWTIDGRVLRVEWTDTTCDVPFGASRSEVVRTEHGLVAVVPTSGSTVVYADDSTPVVRWRIEGDEGGGPRATIARVVGTPGDGAGSGCYWSEDGACGGLFSCSGQIVSWRTEGDTFRGATQCTAECPCTSWIEGTVRPDGAIDATYRGANCERVLSGSFVATGTLE
jgi:hypothetical protein